MKIELAEEQDLSKILELQKRAFYSQALVYNDFKLAPLTQTQDEINEEFLCKPIYKVEKDGKIIASVRCTIDNDVLYVERLIVDPDYQNQGIGANILKELENAYSNTVKRFKLFTGNKSEKSLHLYKKLGYREIKTEWLSEDYALVYLEKANDLTTK
jgi:ribosomal protein S18 acetylase RimI-like enzyme